MKLRYIEADKGLTLETAECTGCGLCRMVCPHEVFAMTEGKAVLADPSACMACGACAMNCPVQALSVNRGVGCAAAIIRGGLTGSAPSCDCDGGETSCC